MHRIAVASALVALLTLACPASKGSPDAGAHGGSDCADILTCLNACTTGDCQQACENAGTTKAQGLINALSNCLESACPSTSTGVCASNTTSCQSCVSAAQDTGGTCETDLEACAADTGVPLTLGCGGLTNCIDACASTDSSCPQNCFDRGTIPARQLYNAIADCFNMACPATGNGVCATETTACDNCVLGAQAQGGACNTNVIACDSDTTGTGSVPPVMNGGGCAALNACLGACASGDNTCAIACEAGATSTGIQDLEALDSCLQTACPTTGICAMPSMGCNTCVTANETTGGACNMAADTCNTD
jgi:hypothetical protein